jgi:hypothetical protein
MWVSDSIGNSNMAITNGGTGIRQFFLLYMYTHYQSTKLYGCCVEVCVMRSK